MPCSVPGCTTACASPHTPNRRWDRDPVLCPHHFYFPQGSTREPAQALCQRDRCTVHRMLTGQPSVLGGEQRRYLATDVLRGLGTAGFDQEEHGLLLASMALCTEFPLEVLPVPAPIPGALGHHSKEPAWRPLTHWAPKVLEVLAPVEADVDWILVQIKGNSEEAPGLDRDRADVEDIQRQRATLLELETDTTKGICLPAIGHLSEVELSLFVALLVLARPAAAVVLLDDVLLPAAIGGLNAARQALFAAGAKVAVSATSQDVPDLALVVFAPHDTEMSNADELGALTRRYTCCHQLAQRPPSADDLEAEAALTVFRARAHLVDRLQQRWV